MKALLRWRRALADHTLRRKPDAVTLVAIARNEGPYLVEWLAHHLAVGFDRIVVYDNESQDDTRALFKALSPRDLRLRRVPWPSPLDDSAQVLAYHHALTGLATPWVMYLDLDEFLVPFGHADMAGLIGSLPEDVSSLHVNWRGFGSSGHTQPGYGLITRAFTRCAPHDWGNHYHFKTLARARDVSAVRIHDVCHHRGRRVLSDGRGFANTSDGTSDRVVYDGVQINHYQCKTLPEFQARMRRGDANFPNHHPGRLRDDTLARFEVLDRNETEDHAIRAFEAPFESEYRRLCAILGRNPALSG
ncbi:MULTISPECIES: glycosyltransferase family 2 protein [Methylorubrum]|uniref:glycosyltransferase family 2 protein n=1 Tax=Methylorubrum TaxID=2282523 RepID=UPI00209E36B5|nr:MULTISPECIES: glycosyltransferase family 2 protein [Methylorubrum]MCP1548838.1 hypothetical protein [Methylorubrum zatmanii]MCP1554549.1 hypothetical protein [Methylorubrum extorquens]MCP1579141.1 hypothetical protein [Methylorubrum extorquens]